MRIDLSGWDGSFSNLPNSVNSPWLWKEADLIEHLRCYGLFVFRISAFAFSTSLSSMVKQAIRPTNGRIKK
jgi:hypothetical protein